MSQSRRVLIVPGQVFGRLTVQGEAAPHRCPSGSVGHRVDVRGRTRSARRRDISLQVPKILTKSFPEILTTCR
jgi:hypothetical protein